MGEHRPPGRREVGARPLNSGVQGLLSFEEPPDTAPGDSPALVVQVLPDVVTLDNTFDYAVPDAWHADGRAERLTVGSIVRVTLGGRRLRAWVTEVGVDPPAGVSLSPLQRLTGMGPSAEVMDLARWAAWRWAGHRVSMLRTASPPKRVAAGEAGSRHSAEARPGAPSDQSSRGGAGRGSHARDRYDEVFDRAGAATVVRCPPAGDAVAVARAAARRGDALVVVPTMGDVRRVAAELGQSGVRVALGHHDWPRAAAGATVVGTRTAVWMPMPRLAAVVVLDEHSESLRSEYTPFWHARDVALERAARKGVPAVLVSPIPSLEALEDGTLLVPGRSAERDGWPIVDVLDRRRDDPTRGGLFAEGLRDRLAGAGGRVAVVLNRKGRGRLLACKACGELARTSDGRVPMRLLDDELVAADGSERRPVVCAQCGSTVLRNLRMGVTRAREDLASLTGERVGEVTSDSDRVGAERIVVGTEAVLWRLESAAAVVFLDFDQELLAPRQRASEQALALLARGARLAGGRRGGGRLVVQTRQSDHPVVQAAVMADPSIVASVDRERRRELGLPPYGAQARVSGPGAEVFITALRQAAGSAEAGPDAAVSVRGPRDGQFLLRAPSHEPLLDLLARIPRPAERLRIEVDPLRV